MSNKSTYENEKFRLISSKIRNFEACIEEGNEFDSSTKRRCNLNDSKEELEAVRLDPPKPQSPNRVSARRTGRTSAASIRQDQNSG